MSETPISARQSGFHDPSEPEKLLPYLRSIWERRSYTLYVSVSDLRDRQINSTLGNIWYLLNPALLIAVYFLIFGLVIRGVNRGTPNYILFLTIGILMYTALQRCVVTGSQAVVRNRGLIQSFSFPRALLPLTSTLTEFIATIPSVLVMLVVALITGEDLALRWFAVAPAIVSLFIMNLGLSLIAARITTYFRDFDQILPFLLRLTMYLSGVLFSVEAMLEGRSFQWVFDINPVYAHVSIARWALMGGAFDMTWLICSTAWASSLMVLGLIWFHAGERHYGNV